MTEKRSFIKRMGSFFSYLFLIVLIPYFIISCILTYSAVTNLNNLPSIFGYKPVVIKNNDLKKDLNKGDLLIIKKEETYALLNRDEIVTYKESTDHYKTGKISSIVSRAEQTEGQDTSTLGASEYRIKTINKNNAKTTSIMSNQIEGVYFLQIPVIGTYLSYIDNNWLLVLSLVVLLILIALFIKIAISCAPKRVKKQEEAKTLELMSAAELTAGENLRDNLIKKETKQENIKPQVQVQPQPKPQIQQQPQPQVQVQNTNPANSLGGGIQIVPPTEANINTNEVPQAQAQAQTQTQPQQQPQVQQTQTIVIPQNNNQNPNQK